MELLNQAVAAGRVIKSKVGGMPMFYFPRREYMRETLYKQALEGQKEKLGGDESFNKMQDDQWGFSWDPASLVPACLDMQEGKAEPFLGLPLPSSGSAEAAIGPTTLVDASDGSCLPTYIYIYTYTQGCIERVVV